MNKQSVNRRREDDDDDDDGSAIDRLCQLPQPILHHILSLLAQKDAVRTCVLSKSWRYLWQGLLNVEFRDNNMFIDKNTEFWSFLDKTLQRYLDQNLSIHKFLVDVFPREVDFVLLQKWIPLLIMNMGVRSFTLIFYQSSIVFPLPLLVFQSQSLVELHLLRCDLSTLKSTDNVMLYNLQTLRLHYVEITDEVFDKIIFSCPLIENLNLISCTGLKSIKLHKRHNIKYFDCYVDDETVIEIEDPHPLESVHIQQDSPNWFLRHKNMQFPHLKSLDLWWVHLPAKIFDNFSSFFPCLNELSLNKCNGLEDEFILSSSSIKRLTIEMNMGHMIKAFIDTPNILYFKYQGFLPSIKFTTTSNEWKSEIFVSYKLVWSDKNTTEWLLKLNKLLKALSQSHITLNLVLEFKKLHINDSYGCFNKPVVVEHLILWERFPSSDPAILDCLFRICRPRYIHMYYCGNGLSNLAVFMSMLIPDEIGCYFWLKDLEEVGIEVRDEQAKEWHCVESTSLRALSFQKRIRFRLTWREQLSKFT
ncbi:hypothetical protein CASFOL_021431 [Castilleja foliolosa]|uniref:F-box domain-containing protein n=1 Tax=Castilleja foliolosa TaxID=1961234 RepID=A0ABD3CXG4_9LAMI